MYKLLFPYFPEEKFLCRKISDREVIKKLTSGEEDYDCLCAGFPCQPYSRAGEKKGYDHSSGKCFDEMLEIVKLYNKNHQRNELRMIMLENVDYLANHNNGETWTEMKEKIKKLGYVFPKSYSFIDSESKLPYLISNNLIINSLDLSHAPLNRSRLFLLAFHKDFFPKDLKEKTIEIPKFVNKNISSIYEGNWLQPVYEFNLLELEEEKKRILDIWADLLDKISYLDLPHPLWLEFFFLIPSSRKKKNIISFLRNAYRKHEKSKFLEILADKEKLKNHEKFLWKIDFARNNWLFYLKHKENIDDWWNKYKKTLWKKKTYCKLELNIKKYYLKEKLSNFFLKDRCVIQFRHSGIRVKSSTYFPTVTRHSSLIIIYDKDWKSYRYLSQQEMLKIFGFSQWKEWKKEKGTSEFISSLGESISVSVLEKIIENFHPEIEKVIEDKWNAKFFEEKSNSLFLSKKMSINFLEKEIDNELKIK